MIEMENQEHPDPNRWWRRKWQLASRGAVFAGLVVLIGIGATLFGSPETAGAVEPFVKIGVWGGLVPLAAYMGAAMVKNIMGVWRK